MEKGIDDEEKGTGKKRLKCWTHANLFPFISDNFFVVGDIMVSEGEM